MEKEKTIKKIPERSEIARKDTWDLSKLFQNDGEWDKGLVEYAEKTEKIPSFQGTLGQSAEKLADWLDFSKEFGVLEERLAYYSELRQTEDEGAAAARAMSGKFLIAAAKAQALSAWSAPEIQAIPDNVTAQFLEHPRIAEYVVYLKKLLRYKPHILSEKEERLLAMKSETEVVPRTAFSVLTNVDIDFGFVDTAEGATPLSQSTWSVLMENKDRDLRRRAYAAFYRQFDAHKHTLAALYAGQVKQNAVNARIRGYPSARAAALFGDNVDEAVYDNLVNVVAKNLAPLRRYYALRKKALGLMELRHYDVYVPIVDALNEGKKRTWEQAVDTTSAALAPLGAEYVGVLRAGLLGRWADRYENKGKRAGAFSAGSYTADPYILMNYKDDSIRDMFTMAHEGGHSMHSFYSAKNNPFMHYNYTIFEAEVASTFNEELLFRYLKSDAEKAGDRDLLVYIVNKRIDDILATLYRQTMFAEFEKRTHELEESGSPLTLDVLRAEYRALLEKYFGGACVFEMESDLEGLRIPHFYGAFYVYKYATGISASLALAERVLGGGKTERDDYFAFLASGGSRFPIDSLKAAGVDMSNPAPIESACAVFNRLVGELEALLDF
ncbi:MAG: oligoendopeptidase F [Treponema sp.]|jgi:oligoendopeptidase F|nr:oligoendopeptidase F [Treponema sp.]